MIEIYGIKIDGNIDNDLYDVLLSFVSEKRRKLISKYMHGEAIRKLYSDVLCRYALCKSKKMKNKQIEFSYSTLGKPILMRSNEIHLNASHSGGWVVCAIHNMPIGIDIEKIEPIDINIAKRFFAPEEYIYICSQPSDSVLPCFYELWTLKESYVKAIGKGLTVALNKFAFEIGDGKITLKTNFQNKNHYFKQFCIDNKYKLSVCSLTEEFPACIEIVTLEDILSVIKK